MTSCTFFEGEHSGNKFLDAFYLSVETAVTIGYGVPDPYMNGCKSGLVFLLGQALLGYILDALLIGIMYQRYALPHLRGHTVIFSEKAVLREIRGRVFFCVQVLDTRSIPVVGAKCNMWYAK